MERLEALAGAKPSYFVLHAEIVPKPVLPRRVVRSRARQRKQIGESTSLTSNSVEVLENRNMERRG